MKARAVIYARVSKEDQAKGFSLDSQLDEMRAYTEALGMRIVGEYVDKESASQYGPGLDRTQLNTIRDLARNGRIDAFVFHNPSRFTRDMADGIILRRELQDNGVRLFCTTLQQEVKADNELINVLVDWQNAEFIRNLREASMRGYARKVQEGIFPGKSAATYGYRKEGQKHTTCLLVRDDTAEIVRSIFVWFVIDRLTVIDIARKLTEMGIPTPGEHWGACRKRGKGIWERAAVYNILRNETYIGRFYALKYIRTKKLRTMRPKEEWACISVPSVVPEDLFQEAQRLLDQGKKLSPRNSNHPYLMARRLTCTCGYAVRTVTTSWRLYYACRSEHKAKGRCGLPYFYADRVDEEVWNWITQLIENTREFLKMYQAAQQELARSNAHLFAQLAQIDAQLAEYQEQAERLLQLYMKGLYPLDRLEREKLELDEIISGLTERGEELAAQINEITISDDFIATMEQWATEVKAYLERHEADFDFKLECVQTLDLKGKLAFENGEKVLYLYWCMREYRLVTESGIRCLPLRP